MKPQVKVDLLQAVWGYTYTEYLSEYVAGQTPNGPEGFADYVTFRNGKDELTRAIQAEDTANIEKLERELMLV